MTTPIKFIITGAVTLLSAFQSVGQIREDDPWFEIELVAFARTSTTPLSEKFMPQVKPIRNRQALDLLSPLYIPDLRPALLAITPCEAKPAYVFTSLDPWAEYRQPYDFSEVVTETQEPATNATTNSTTMPDDQQMALTQFLPNADLCRQFPYIRSNYATDLMDIDGKALIDAASPLVLPITPIGSDDHQDRAYLAPDSALQMKDLAYQLRNRAGHDVLLHMVWRQALSSKNRASWQRIFAGKRFSPEFDYQGRKQFTQAPELSGAGIDGQIEVLYQRLKQQQPLPTTESNQQDQTHNLPLQVWQLEGQVRLYNERMLFVDTEFNFRTVDRNGLHLQSFYSKDNTRLLLEELHYLDHPYFGLVFQIRRFTPPLKPTMAVMAEPAVSH